MPQKKLSEQHIEYIHFRVAQFEISSSKIAVEIGNPEIAEQFKFPPLDISQARVSQIINHELKLPVLNAFRAEHLNDFTMTPLAFPKKRVEELTAFYNYWCDKPKKADGKDCSDNYIQTKKMAILREIREETRDDLKRITDMMEKAAKAELGFKDLLLKMLTVPADFKKTNDADGTKTGQTAIH